MHRPILSLCAALLVTTGTAACGSSGSSGSGATTHTSKAATAAAPATTAPRSSATIDIQNFAYHPANVTLTQGAKVTFVNMDSTAHTATEKAGPAKFDTGTLNPGKSMTLTLNAPGSYTYFCQFHAFMVAHLTVVKK